MAERNDKGQFVKGTVPNPKGRPKREVERAYYDATIGAVSLDEWRLIVAKAKDQALLGDDKARAWLGDYVLGKPQQQIDMTTGDAPLNAAIVFGFIPPRSEGESAEPAENTDEIEGEVIEE